MSFIKTDAAAALLGVTEHTVNKWVREGVMRFGRRVYLRRYDINHREKRFREADVQAFIEKGGRYA